MNKHNGRAYEDRQFVILTKLNELGPMNLIEIGFSASPQTIHNMAKRGLIRVTVEMMDRGKQSLTTQKEKRLRQKTNLAKEQRIAARLG